MGRPTTRLQGSQISEITTSPRGAVVTCIDNGGFKRRIDADQSPPDVTQVWGRSLGEPGSHCSRSHFGNAETETCRFRAQPYELIIDGGWR